MIYVDDAGIPADVHNRETGRTVRGRWSHLTADTREELIEFATSRLGLRASYFQTCKMTKMCPPETCPHFHFDVTVSKRKAAIEAGAVEVDIRRFGEIIREHRAAQRESSP